MLCNDTGSYREFAFEISIGESWNFFWKSISTTVNSSNICKYRVPVHRWQIFLQTAVWTVEFLFTKHLKMSALTQILLIHVFHSIRISFMYEDFRVREHLVHFFALQNY